MSEETSVFDPEVFMNAIVTEAGDTEYPVVPEGEWLAVIKAVKGRVAKNNHILDVNWSVIDPVVTAQLGRDEIPVRQSIFLDLNPSGTLDMGKYKNTQLNRLREAVDLNKSGFALPMLVGATARVKVVNRKVDDETYSDVKGVIPA